MNKEGGSPEMKFRGTFNYQSVASAADLESEILTARLHGRASPVLEVNITLEDSRTDTLVVELIDEPAEVSDAGTTYRFHRLPYGDTEVHGVTLLIPHSPDGKKALVSVSY